MLAGYGIFALPRRILDFIIKVALPSGFSALVFAGTDDLAMIDHDDGTSPPKIGNFALPGPQQPGPFLSFGQTLVGRNYVDVSFATFSPYRNISQPFNNLNLAITYGISDNTSFYFNLPIKADSATRMHAFHGLSSGLRDVSLQLEQAVYAAGNSQYEDQATIVGAISLPTQLVDTTKTPSGYGALSYFFGTTYNRTYVDWLGFVSPGVVFTTVSDGVRLGSQFMYQAGLGRNILYVGHTSSLFGLLELDGQFTAKNQVLGHDSVNSGGNVVALTPSLSLATKSFMSQVGVGYPFVQNLNGKQKKTNFFIAANFSWTIS